MSAKKFNVGGVLLDRPFRIKRLGHFQYLAKNLSGCLEFYLDHLGFMISDVMDFSSRLPPELQTPEKLAEIGDTKLYFTRYGSDHHSFLLSTSALRKALGRDNTPGITVSQITWQVGSLNEVAESIEWIKTNQVPIMRTGRDAPGSNWHVYVADPAGFPNELYYGIEQIGWDGRSKPKQLRKGLQALPSLPQSGERAEIQKEIDAGLDLYSGHRHTETLPDRFDVGGVLLPRPFKVVGIGPVRLFVEDMEAALSYYRDLLGLRVTEEVTWGGYRCVFLRAGAEHHSMALYPKAIREILGLSDHSLCMSFGVRVHDYSQLRAALDFLREKDVKILHLPTELFPGIDYSAFAVDPEGHLVQLYWQMEQIGWDGRPRPADQRPPVDNGNWPDTIDAPSDAFHGESFLGPWA